MAAKRARFWMPLFAPEQLGKARAAFADFFANFNYLWALHDNDRYSGRVDFDTLVEQELILVGSPATVRAQLERYVAAAGGNYFAGTFAFGSLTGDQILRPLDLFAREVMPAFRRPPPGRLALRAVRQPLGIHACCKEPTTAPPPARAAGPWSS